MKKLLFILVLAGCFSGSTISTINAQEVLSQTELGSVEQMLFNNTYSGSSMEERLARIEAILYGQSLSQEPVQNRMQKVKAYIKRENIPQISAQQPQQQQQPQSMLPLQSAQPPATTKLEPLDKLATTQPLPDKLQKALSDMESAYNDDILPPRDQSYFMMEPPKKTEKQTRNTVKTKKEKINRKPKKNNTAASFPEIDNSQLSLPQNHSQLPDIPGMMQDNFAPLQPQQSQQNYNNSSYAAPSDTPQNYNATHPEVLNNQQDYANQSVPGEADSDYPLVDELEQALLGRSFAGENIYKRVERLELKLHGRAQSGSLYDRVTGLQEKSRVAVARNNFTPQNLPPVDSQTNSAKYLNYKPQITQPPQAHSAIPKSHRMMNSQSQQNSTPMIGFMSDKISAIEQQVFGKTYDNDLSMNRLDRLEKKVFGKTGFGMLGERLNRVSAALSGQNVNISSSVPADTYMFTDDGFDDDDSYQGGNSQPRPQFMFGGSMGMNSTTEYSNTPYQSNNYPVAPTQGGNNMVDQLEIRIFGHSYPNMDINTRLSRMENTMFGRMLGGDMQTRLQNLLQATQNYGYNGYNNSYQNYGYGGYPQTPYNSYYQQPYGYGMPVTTGNLASTVANAALQKTLSNKGGVLSQVGKAAGNMLLGNYNNPYGNYANPYGYGGYNNSYYGY